MKKLLLSPIALFFTASILNAQVPIAYYDFDNNSSRNVFENSVEQQVNLPSSSLVKRGGGVISGVSGAAAFNGAAPSVYGQALSSNSWDTSSVNPSTTVSNFYEFTVNTAGFSGLSLSFDNVASGNGPAAAGVLWSSDGTTFNSTSVIPTGNASFSNSGLISIPTGADNATSLVIRIYAFAADRTGRPVFDNNGTFAIDNLTIYASMVTASKTLLDYTAIGASLRANSNTPFNPVYNNLEINGAGITVGLNTTLQLAGVLTLTNGSFNTNNVLVLKSTEASTARVAPVTNGTITGNVTVERFIRASNNRAYRLLTPSVNTSTSIHANWQENAASNTDDPNPGYGTHITGATTDQIKGFDGSADGAQSLFTFNQTTQPQMWQAVDNTNSSNLEANKGYLLFVRGDRSSSNLTSASSSNTVLRATGTLQVGDVTLTGLEGNGRFNLVANPYASPIGLLNSYSNPINQDNFEKYFIYWSPKIGRRGGFVTVSSAGHNSAGENIDGTQVQSGQAFFVKSKAGVASPTIVFKELDKSNGSNSTVFRTGSAETLKIKLMFDLNGDRKVADGVIVGYDNSFSKAVEGADGLDNEEIANFDENIAIARDGKMLSIEGRPLIDSTDTIPLSVARLQPQQYQWQFEPESFSAPNLQAFLQDKFLNIKTPISLTSTTVIPFNVIADTASASSDRFMVTYSALATLPIELGSVKAYQKSTGIQVEWNTLTESNVEGYEVERSANGQQFTKVGKVSSAGNTTSLKTYSWFDAAPVSGNNYYRVSAVSKTGTSSYSSIVKVSLNKTAASVSVYPNPVVDNSIGLQITNLATGNYTVTLTNKLGQQVYSKNINHYGGSASLSIQTTSIAKGIYQLQVKGDSAIISTQVIKQ